ncbi:MAG: 30S ribosomal protein S20 [Spirochaetes bacterium GWD1_27_9]|nr:MAG: 30S ribosomal protein S20 [Spirochaetes bacterium GWB1_27_13]OHD23400.1 MAG: 30S ribosomal protein S20 [Spirochaetes bacterium GWC1_27_15]OHD43023.1 MAG: 30S ribosomal protein S20 [Spirochaetes bacterium GWD1_27_9]
MNRSVLKRERQNKVRRDRNRVIKSKVHTAKIRLVEAIETKNREDVEMRLRTFMSEVDKAVKRNIFHRNKGARLKSRIVKKIKDVFNEHKQAS